MELGTRERFDGVTTGDPTRVREADREVAQLGWCPRVPVAVHVEKGAVDADHLDARNVLSALAVGIAHD